MESAAKLRNFMTHFDGRDSKRNLPRTS